MVTGGGLEKVVNKKEAKNSKNFSKGPKKSSLDNMPHIQPISPIKLTPTIFEAFWEEELWKEENLLEAEKSQLLKESKKPNVNQIKKKDKQMPLEKCLRRMDINVFDAILEKDKATCPDHPEIWLMLLTFELNSKLNHSYELNPISADKPLDYPLCLMSYKSKEFFINKLRGFQNEVYVTLLEHCIEELVKNITRDQRSIGYRLMIQLLAKEHSVVILNSLQKYESLIQENNNQPLECLCILWAVGQVGNYSLYNGIKVWFSLMFGLIAVKGLNEYVLSYLEKLFGIHCHHEDRYNVLSETDYFKFFGKSYSELSTLPCSIRERLQLLHPRVKEIAWGNVANNLNVFFIGYLSRLTSDCSENKKAELLECLAKCLEKDSKSFDRWKKEYHKKTSQSSLLLKYLEANIERLNINQDLLTETAKAFQMTNEDLAQKLPSEHLPLESCNAGCKAILFHKKRKSYASKPLFFVLALFAALVVGDMYFHGSFEASFHNKCLTSTKSMPIVDQTSQKCDNIPSWIGPIMIEGFDSVNKSVVQMLDHPPH